MSHYEQFFADLEPMAKARPRVTRRGTYMPRPYQEWRRRFCAACYKPDQPIAGSLSVIVQVYTKSGKMRPDLDNVVGAVLDALQDAQVIANDRSVTAIKASIERDKRAPGIYVKAEGAAAEAKPEPKREPVYPPRWFPWDADPIEVRDYVWRRKRAQKKVQRAMASGRLIRNNTCERCGFTWDGTLTSKIHAHHEDYNEPLSVVWLCGSCHGKRHNEINKEWQAKHGLR